MTGILMLNSGALGNGTKQGLNMESRKAGN
jgi:hypothetical protein